MYKVHIAYSQTELEAIINLRYTILRKPWNKPKASATDELELQSVNAFIMDNDTCVACGRLQINDLNIAQIRFMAVDERYQGKGLGTLIVNALEQEAKKRGAITIELHARENAVEFYKALHYTVIKASHILWEIIPHYLMQKII